MRKSKQNQHKLNMGKIYIISFLLFILYVFGGYFAKNILLINYGMCKRAVMTNNKSTWTSRFSQQNLMYEFECDGKLYRGNSLINDESRVGDSICIVYLGSFPNINRSVSFFDEGDIKCNCR